MESFRLNYASASSAQLHNMTLVHLVHLVRELLPSRALASISLDRWSRLAGPESSEGGAFGAVSVTLTRHH